MRQMFELLSSMVTVTTIILAFTVVKYWYPKAKLALNNGNKFDVTAWLAVGIFVSFLGQMLDNSYWLMAWSANYIDHTADLTTWFFENGVYFNIPFRQACGIISAYCHIRAAVLFAEEDHDDLKGVVGASVLLGTIYSICLMLVR